ncbi:MAG: EamA family transporter [Thermoguttaceae bacterium]
MFRLIAASIIWSFSFGLVGNTLAGVPAASLVAWRLTLAACVFLPFVRTVSVRTAAAFVGVGAVQFGLMSLAYTNSFRYLPSHQVALFTVLTPIYVVAICDIFARRWRWRLWSAAGIAVTGAAVVLWTSDSFATSLVGFALVECANLTFAIGQVFYRRITVREGVRDENVFFWLYAGAIIVAAVPAWFEFGSVPTLTTPQILTVIYLGVIASGASYFLWNSGARRVSDGTLAVMNNVKIPLGVFVSIVAFGESANAITLAIGAGLIATALAVAMREANL